MRAMYRTVRYAAGLMTTLLTIACSDSTGPGGPKIGVVSIAAPRTMLEIGDSMQFSVTVLDESGVSMSGHSVTWRSSNPAVLSVRASGLGAAHSAGTTYVTVTGGERSDSVEISVRPATCTSARATGNIAVGQTRSGSHGAVDCLYESEPTDGWRFDVTFSTIVRINLTSASGGAQLIVTDLQLNVIAWGYDSDGSSQVFAPFAAGSYVLWARSPSGSSPGDYQISAVLHQTPPCSVTAGTIAVDDTVNSLIESSDCAFFPEHYADSWQLSLASTTTVQIDLSSAEFDATLLVTNVAGQWIAYDDDGGGYPNSRIVVTLPAGDYFLVASTYSAGAMGQYQLAVQPASSASVSRRGPAFSRDARRGAGALVTTAWPVVDKPVRR